MQSVAAVEYARPLSSPSAALAQLFETRWLRLPLQGSGKTLAFGLPALAHTQAQLAAGVADGGSCCPFHFICRLVALSFGQTDAGARAI